MPSGREWNHCCFSFFWGQETPNAIRHEMEKRTGVMLEPAPPGTHPLAYAGMHLARDLRGRIELRFEAAALHALLYSLRFDAARPHGRFGEARFVADAQKLFDQWLRGIRVTQNPGDISFAEGEHYLRLVTAALDFEAGRSAVPEDQAAVSAAQQAVLGALRGGRRYVRLLGGPEGTRSILIHMEGATLVKREIGEQESVETYGTEARMLAFLRAYFDFEARRATFPQKPPETEIWEFIRYQLK